MAAEPLRGLGGRLRRLSLRSRLILLGTAGLAVGLAFGGFVLVTVLRTSLERTVDSAATQTARDVAALIDANRLPDPIPAGGTTVVQVVDRLGRVRAASAGADRLVPGLSTEDLNAVRGGTNGYLPGSLFGVSDVVRVVAVDAGPADDRQTVIVATPAGDIAESARVVQTGLLIGFGLLLLILVGLAWRIVGATLRPVEALRLGAEKITGASAAGSLPVPHSQDEIAALAMTLNRMLSRLDRSSQRQRAFVADEAHELRSPLASLRTQIEVAKSTGSAETSDLLAEVERMSRLVDDLLLLARIDESLPARREPVDLAVLAGDVVARYVAARVPVRVAAAFSVQLTADPRALDRALANLIDNAVRYASTKVDVRVETNGPDAAVITVTDDGPGIAAADRDRVFDRFTRLADARDRDSGGSGLGLAIVGELIAAQGGALVLRDADPPGPPGPGRASRSRSRCRWRLREAKL